MDNAVINKRYKIIKKIADGRGSAIHLARNVLLNENNSKDVIIKILKKECTSTQLEDIVRFKNEAMVVFRLSHDNIAKIFDIGEIEEEYYIAMEYVSGTNLSNSILGKWDSAHFSLEKRIDIITQICSGLESAHNAGVIHKALKPDNIMLEENEFRVKIIGFGIANIKDFNSVSEDEEIAHTFCYMSPEQCGVLKRDIDQRSDLYALGVISYQLLTGKLPFSGNNVHTIIHQHVAKLPGSLRLLNPAIPQSLNKIILKLLEKDPDNRYQTVRGLLADLQKIKNGQVDFTLGMNDGIKKLNNHTCLIGREKEWEKLKQTCLDAHKGCGTALFINGEAGSGKTRLTEELQGFAFENRCAFIYSKCFSGENKTPYGPFRDMLNHYLKIFKKYPERKKTKIRSKLHIAPGGMSGVVFKLEPLLEEIIGKVSPSVKLSPDRENERFLMELSKFICHLGKAEDGFVLVLDDLQWADKGSLSVLNELLKNISSFPLFIVGTYRSDEVDEQHGVKKIRREAVEKFYPLVNMFLSAFDLASMTSFIESLLSIRKEHVNEIADFIWKKSNGNPFFCKEILKHIIDEKIVIPDENNEWKIDNDSYKNMQIPNTVVSILMKRISLLKQSEKDILSYAAVIGKEFDVGFIIKLMSSLKETTVNKEEIVGNIDRARELQLLEKDAFVNGKLTFTHDRIKEVFYEKMLQEKRTQLHLEIAKTIEQTHKDELEENILSCECLFDIAHHYIMGADEKKVLKYAFWAGLRAKDNYANLEAIRYLDMVKIILEKELATGKNENRKMWVECIQYIGDIYIRIGRNDDAIGLYSRVMDYIDLPVKRAEIYKQISQAYFKKGDWTNCEKFGKIGLELLGETLPTAKVNVYMAIIKEVGVRVLHRLFPALCIRKKTNPQSEKYKLIAWFYYSLFWLYVFSNTKKLIRLALRAVNLAEYRIGPARETAMSIRAYAAILSIINSPLLNDMKYHNKALELSEGLHDSWGIGQSYQLIGYFSLYKGLYHISVEHLDKSVEQFRKIGDIRELGISMEGLYHAYYLLSDCSKARDFSLQYSELSKKADDIMGISIAKCNLTKYEMVRGDLDKAINFALESLDLSNKHNLLYVNCISNIDLGILFHQIKNYTRSDAFFSRAKELIENNKFFSEYIIFYYPEYANAIIDRFYVSRYSCSSDKEKLIIKKIKKACRIALKKTRNFDIKYFIALYVNAKYYAIIGKSRKANKLFLQSIKLGKKVGEKYEIAKCYYEYGRFLSYTGEKRKAKENWEKAYIIFKEQKSEHYVKIVSDLLGVKNTMNITPIERFMRKSKDNTRYTSILELLNEISLNQNIQHILKRAMTLTIELTGAENGYFVIKEINEKLKIIASVNVNDTELDHVSRDIIYETFKKETYILSANIVSEDEVSSGCSDLKSVLSLPVKIHGDVKAVYFLSNSLIEGVFTEDDIEVLQILMTQVAILIDTTSCYSGGGRNAKDYGITRREMEIITWFSKGYNNKEIGKELLVSENTVRNHLRNIYKKTGAKNKIQLLNIFEHMLKPDSL